MPTTAHAIDYSCGVGEDGPTHQPVETVAGLRVIPNLDVIRPADPEETQAAFVAALQRTDGPTLLSLTRQVSCSLPACGQRGGGKERGREGMKRAAVKLHNSVALVPPQ